MRQVPSSISKLVVSSLHPEHYCLVNIADPEARACLDAQVLEWRLSQDRTNLIYMHITET